MNHTNLDPIKLSPFYRNISLGMMGCALVIRVFLPGLTVGMGENALLWIFSGAAFFFATIDFFGQGRPSKIPTLVLSAGALFLFFFLSAWWAGDKILCLYQSMVWLSDLLLFLTFWHWRGPEVSSKLFGTLMACLVLESVYSIYQYFIGLPATRLMVEKHPELLNELEIPQYLMDFFHVKLNISHVFGHFTVPNSLGGYLILFLPVLGILGVEARGKGARHILYMLTVFGLVILALLLTVSRGSMLCLGMALAVWGAWWAKNHFVPSRFSWGLLGVSTASVVFVFLCTFTHVLDFLGAGSLTLVMRVAYWASGIDVWTRNPFFGVGVGNFKYHYYASKYVWAEEVNKAHNCYLQLLIETGLIGASLLLLFLWEIARGAKADEHPGPEKGKNREAAQIWPYLFPVSALFGFFILILLGHSFELESLAQWIAQKTGALSWGVCLFMAYLVLLGGLLLWFHGFYFFQTMSISPQIVTGLKVGLLAMAFHNFLDIDFYDPALSLHFWMILALVFARTKLPHFTWNASFASKAVCMFVAASGMAFLSLFLVPDWIKSSSLKMSLPVLQHRLFSEKEPDARTRIWQRYCASVEEGMRISPWEDKFASARSSLIVERIKAWLHIREFRQDVRRIEALFEEAQHSLDTMIRYKPDSATAYSSRAFFFIEQADIWKKLGLSEKERRSVERAGEEMIRALRLYPDKCLFLTFSGEIAERKGDMALALRHYKRAIFMEDMQGGTQEMKPAEKEKLISRIAAISKTLENR